MKNERRKLAGVIALFAPLAWVVSGVYQQDFSNYKLALDSIGEGLLNSAEEVTLLLTGFLSSQNRDIAQDSIVILNLLSLLFLLTFTWIARYSLASKRTTIREAIYTSGTALVPFLLLIILAIIQIVPFAAAVVILSSISGDGFTLALFETIMFVLAATILIVISLYFISGTIIALQVVSLPGMYPWRALQNARRLIIGRRLSVLSKFIMLAIVIAVGWILLFIPLLLLDDSVCSSGGSCWTTFVILPLGYYVITGLSLAFASTYVYIMYRSLLAEEN